MIDILYGVALFTAVVLALVGLILVARQFLVSTGAVKIMVNGQKEIEVAAGGKLMNALGEAGIFVSSACGGGGTCAQCLVKVGAGGGDLLETEKGHIRSKRRLTRSTIKISTFKTSTTLTGTSSTFGAISQRSRTLPSEPTRWRTIRARRASSCLTCVWLRLLRVLPKAHLRERCHRLSLILSLVTK
jgi:ferredoxin